MIDDIIAGLPKPERITREHFIRWQNDPVTRSLFLNLIETYLTSIDETLPPTIEGAAAIALKREGFWAAIEELSKWQPKLINDEDKDDEA